LKQVVDLWVDVSDEQYEIALPAVTSGTGAHTPQRQGHTAVSHIRYRYTHSTASRPHSCQSHQVPVHTFHSVKVTRDTHVCVSNSQGGMLPTFTSGTGTHIPQRQGHTAVSHTAGREGGYQRSHQVPVHTFHSVKVTRDTHVCVSNSQGGMLPTFTSGTGTHIPQRQGHTAVSHTAGRERCYQRSHRDSATLMIPVAWRSNVTLHLPEAEYQRGRGGYIVSPARDVVQRTNNHTSQEAPYYGRASANGYGHFPKI